MELREYLRVLRRRWILIALVVLVGLAAAIALTAATQKTYRATARDFVNVPVSLSTSQNSALAAASQFAQARVKSYVGLADSDTVLRPVIEKLKLSDTSVSDLADKITIENPVDTVLLDVSATDHDPARAALLSNAVANQLTTAIEALEVSRTGSQSQVTVTVIRDATAPTSAESPRPLLNYALGLVIGLAVGVIAAVARERLDNGLRTVDGIAGITGTAPLGSVPYSKELADEPLVALRTRSVLAEAYRTIRTRIEFVDVDRPPKRIVVTSSVPAEGKSVGACNLAITIAATGKRVCLIEGDLRRPRVAGYLGFDAGAGLSDVLANQYRLDDVLVPWNDGLLTLLPAGTAPPDPSNLLGSQQMRDLLAQLSERFDMVIIDAPPLLPVTDAAVLTAAADGAVVMVRLGSTRRTELSRALASLEQANVRLLGTVATFTSAKSDDYGDPYGYGYLDDQNDLVLGPVENAPPAVEAAVEPDATTELKGATEPKDTAEPKTARKTKAKTKAKTATTTVATTAATTATEPEASAEAASDTETVPDGAADVEVEAPDRASDADTTDVPVEADAATSTETDTDTDATPDAEADPAADAVEGEEAPVTDDATPAEDAAAAEEPAAEEPAAEEPAAQSAESDATDEPVTARSGASTRGTGAAKATTKATGSSRSSGGGSGGDERANGSSAKAANSARRTRKRTNNGPGRKRPGQLTGAQQPRTQGNGPEDG